MFWLRNKKGNILLHTQLKASPVSLRCGPWARLIYPSLALVQPRKTHPYITNRLLMGRKESNQPNNNPALRSF